MAWLLYKKIKYQSNNAQKIRHGEIASNIFETYKKYMIPHDRHIYQTASDMYMDTMSA